MVIQSENWRLTDLNILMDFLSFFLLKSDETIYLILIQKSLYQLASGLAYPWGENFFIHSKSIY
jgi:hypothetical protein